MTTIGGDIWLSMPVFKIKFRPRTQLPLLHLGPNKCFECMKGIFTA